MIRKCKKTACLLLAGMLVTQGVAIDSGLQVVRAEETVETNAELATEVLEIATLEGFKAFAARVNAGETFEGKVVRLTNDIAFDGVSVNNFEPITGVFSGVFDGAGHSISGIIMVEYKGCLFQQLTSATVKNLIIKECDFDTTDAAAGLAYSVKDSKILNCQVKDTVNIKGKNNSAGFVVSAENSSIISCENSAIVTGGSIAAGIICNANTSMIFNCSNKNSVESTYDEKWASDIGAAGGIVAISQNTTINGCCNQGLVTALCYTAGIVANAKGTKISNSVNKGNIIGKKALKMINTKNYVTEENNFYIGGIAGIVGYSNLNNCSNQSDVEGYISRHCWTDTSYDRMNYIGGLIGSVNNSTSYIQNCFQAGNVIAKNWEYEWIENKESELIGTINGSKTVINNTYFIADQTHTENEGDGIDTGAEYATTRNLLTKTTIEMQSPDFLVLLNSNRGSNTNWLPWIATDTYPTIKQCGVVMINNSILEMYEEGTTVTFTAVPSAEGYQISAPIINEGVISYQDNGDGTYTFVMPAGDVQIDYEETKIIVTPTPTVEPTPTIEVTATPEITATPTAGSSATPIITNTPVPTGNTTSAPATSTSTPVPTKAPTLAPKNTPAPIPVVAPTNKSLVLYVGGTTQKTKKYTVKVSNVKNYSITYESSNKSVASVSSTGTITAKKAGTAVIYIHVKDKDTGKSYPSILANVTVKNAGLSFAKKVSSLKVKKTATFKVKKNGLSGTVKWSVSNKKLASITSKGVLKAKKAGKVKVTATCGKKKVTATVTIKK